VIEVTTAVHANEYLVRELIDEGGVSFGVKRVSRDKSTRQVVSEPYVYGNHEVAKDLADQILHCLREKSEKGYPPRTVLIVNCITNSIVHDDEWHDAVERVKDAQAHFSFAEVFLIDLLRSHSATLYGQKKRARKRKPK
jgi:hypothetical protein